MLLENNLMSCDGTTCPSCKGKLVLDMERGEEICSQCGMVLDAQFHAISSESISFFSASTENENLKNPTSLMMYDIGLSTFINKKNVDSSGKKIQGYYEVEKLRRLNKFTISNDSKTRNLSTAIREILRITEILGLSPSIAERAGYIYRKALSKKLIRGRSITGIVAATIYIACKDAEVHFPMEQMENLADNCNRKNIVHYYKLLLRQMKMKVGIPYPSKYLSRLAAATRLSGKTERRALEILSQIEGEPVLQGKKPVSLAAASLYLAALQVGEHTTQLRIAIASELTTLTIRKRYTEIDEILRQKSGQASHVSNDEIEETVLDSQENDDAVEVFQMTR